MKQVVWEMTREVDGFYLPITCSLRPLRVSNAYIPDMYSLTPFIDHCFVYSFMKCGFARSGRTTKCLWAPDLSSSRDLIIENRIQSRDLRNMSHVN